MIKVKKRNGDLVPFKISKVENAIKKAFSSCGLDKFDETIKDIASEVSIWNEMSVEDIQDQIEELLMDWNFSEVAKAYILYRHKQATLREGQTKKVFLSIINTENNDVTRENANMNSDSPAGMMMKFASESTKSFVDNYLLSKDVLKAVKENYIHIHDKDYYVTKSLTCIQTPLDKILHNGFKSGHGESRSAKRIETAATLACISMETTQNEQHGGQAIPAFDFYLAPFVKATYIEECKKLRNILYDPFLEEEIKNPTVKEYLYKDLPENETHFTTKRLQQAVINNTVKRVHQAMEGFIHNMNQIHSRGGRLY